MLKRLHKSDSYVEETTQIRWLSWRDYTNQVNLIPCLIQNIPWYITSPNWLSLHCKQISKVKNELHGQPSSLLASMHLSIYEATFSPMHLVCLELDTHRPHLDFKTLDENNNEVIPTTFYIQLLNKKWAYMIMKQQAKFIQI